MEHNSEECLVCKELGNFAETADTQEWLEEHEEARIAIELNSRDGVTTACDAAIS